jgi:hypothetical protein
MNYKTACRIIKRAGYEVEVNCLNGSLSVAVAVWPSTKVLVNGETETIIEFAKLCQKTALHNAALDAQKQSTRDNK